MLPRKIQFHTLVTASIVFTVVCATPWVDIVMAQDQYYPTAQAEPVPKDDRNITVYTLKHSAPEQVVATIQALFDVGIDATKIRMEADSRSNRVIVLADRETQKKIGALVKELDVPATARQPVPNDESVFKIYKLQHRAPENLIPIFQTLFDVNRRGSSRIRMAADSRTNRLIVNADVDTQATIEAIVNRLDLPATPRQPVTAASGGGGSLPVSVELRILWLATGLKSDQGSDLPTELQPVADALEKKDIKDLRLVGQVMVNTQFESQFSTSSSPAFGDSLVELNVDGEVERRPEALSVFIQLTATKEVGANHRKLRLANLYTTILVKPGEYMVLGLAPVQGTTSVFVVQANLIE